MPEHFEQAASLVTPEMVKEAMPCGPDLGLHLEVIQRFADAGVDELYVQQIGGDHDAFFRAYAKEILPRFTEQPTNVSPRDPRFPTPCGTVPAGKPKGEHSGPIRPRGGGLHPRFISTVPQVCTERGRR